MSKRFDELELHPGTAPVPALPLPPAEIMTATAAPRLRRAAALLIDISLFAALALALMTLVPEYADREVMLEREWPALTGIAAFLVLLSFFYFAGCWLIWGRTIGGTIFNLRIAKEDGTPTDLRRAATRWLGLYLSFATLGIGFLFALLPGGRSLADRLSGTSGWSE